MRGYLKQKLEKKNKIFQWCLPANAREIELWLGLTMSAVSRTDHTTQGRGGGIWDLDEQISLG